MKIILFILILLFSTTTVFAADYDSRKYIPKFVPYNFDDAVEMSSFDVCAVALNKFDEGYYLLEWKEIPGSEEGAIYYRYTSSDPDGITSLSQLKSRVEDEIRKCIAKYPEYIVQQEEIEAKVKEQEEKKLAEQERKESIIRALENCDFNFFEDMTSSEKMDTFSEREACEANAITQNESNKEVAPVVSLPENTYLSNPKQELESAPAAVKTIPTNPPSTINLGESPEVEYGTEIVSSTTNEEITTVKQGELNQTEDEKAAGNLLSQENISIEVTEEPKQSIFKRVFNFFFGWMF